LFEAWKEFGYPRSVRRKGDVSLFRFALSPFEALDKSFDELRETFGNGNLLHNIVQFPEPLSEECSNLAVGGSFF
jgi:hypothetical protein